MSVSNATSASEWRTAFLDKWKLCLQETQEIDTVTELTVSIGSKIAKEFSTAKSANDLKPVKDVFNAAISQPLANDDFIINKTSIEATKHLMEGAILVIDGYFLREAEGNGQLLERIDSINKNILSKNMDEAKIEFTVLVSDVFKEKIELSSFFLYNLPKNLEFKTRQWACALSIIHQNYLS